MFFWFAYYLFTLTFADVILIISSIFTLIKFAFHRKTAKLSVVIVPLERNEPEARPAANSKFMKCQSCQNEIPQNSRFCLNCGAPQPKLEIATNSTQAADGQ